MDFCEDLPLAGLVFVEEGEGCAVGATAGGAADAMGVGTRRTGEVDVDHEIDGLEVNATMAAVFCFGWREGGMEGGDGGVRWV